MKDRENDMKRMVPPARVAVAVPGAAFFTDSYSLGSYCETRNTMQRTKDVGRITF